MIPTLTGILILAIGLWWLWLVLIGPIFFVLRPASFKLLAAILVMVGMLYLALTPLEGLKIAPPAYATAPPPSQVGSSGMPEAEIFEWNLLPGLYDVANSFFIPLLKHYWAIWIPG